ncbi:GntR family transcriptional regulator [Catellatospora sp. TT07R-123]|uniref:GntR family transcriptional regulator n=1 Tax=Catellatospora sp. TT07R-123 TaxID=2733863 RepID=UPI001BB3007A|nr:GntR family transcriptional regulator [Catellatospora sp. TT07R-123]
MATIETSRSQYAQIAELVRSRIADGTYPPGSALPSEDRLADELRVSRPTVNKALTILRNTGEIKVRRGAGTVVRSLPTIFRDAKKRYVARNEGNGAAEVEVSRHELHSRTVYREIGKATPPAAVADILGLAEGEPALLRGRVLYANDEPTQIADSYIPWSLADGQPDLLRENAGRGGSYGRLADAGYPPTRFAEDITVRMPTDAEQRVLELEPTQPVFEIWHVAYSHDRPIEVCVHVMAGHLWKLHYEWDDATHDQAA